MSGNEELVTPRPDSTAVSDPEGGKPNKGVSDAGTKSPKKYRLLWVWAAFAVLCIGGLAGGLGAYFANKNRNSSSNAPTTSTPETPETINNQTGTFSTSLSRQSTSQTTFTSWIPFRQPFFSPPDVALNLQMIDLLPGSSTLGIDTTATNITTSGFTVRVATTHDTAISDIAGQWMAIPPSVPQWSPDYQTGQFGILSVRDRADTGHANNAGEVFFKRPYATPPKVVVWIHAFDFGANTGWRLNAFPTNIRGKGFTVNVNSWSNTVLYSANVSWVAWPAEEKGVAGNYWTPTMKRINGTAEVANAGFTNTSWIPFNQGVKRRTFPELMMGFSQVDVAASKAGMKLAVENGIASDGVNCTVRSFGNVTVWTTGLKVAWLVAT